MRATNDRKTTKTRARPAWLLAAAVAMALGPAAARAKDQSAALQPEQIRTVQRALQQHGLQVEPTGAWDEPTRSALAEFQGSQGLPRTAELDPATTRALGVDPRAVMPVSGRNAGMASWTTQDPYGRDAAYNCETNNTVDCGPTGG